ncbi:MAG: shikimate dehydrogenase [Deltaproteobacteria bacterium]|nr:shikimate dehydrogenase [Deltaproteobacteria bacterium]
MAIDGATEIYGIMGNPVHHSMSPAMHNAAFSSLRLNKAYVPFPVKDVPAALRGFRASGVKGLSITIPHKQTVIPFLDKIDPVAVKIGAVNTIKIDNGIIYGCNTDWLGANRAIEELTPLAGKKVLLIGDGGAARAVGFGLVEAGAQVVLTSRTQDSGKALAAAINCPWRPLSAADDLRADILINATSAGMNPLADFSPFPALALRNFTIVMDIVYAPLKTRLLREAKTAGCQTINGLNMLLFQGAAQFELWTGLTAPIEIMRQQLQKITA